MGAWGRKVFQNDTALDLVDEVLDGTFDLDEFRKDFRREEDEGYLDASQGAALLALGALVRIARNEDHADLDVLLEHAEAEEVDLTDFIDQFSDEDIQTLRELIGVVIREPSSSELYELWEESGELEQWLEYSRQCLP
ncbi:DUF4259 domain-containing protein [Micrococcus endophyticus]|uniref:Uncharacterized protein n=1 Tax=Micrococcus endophyticus TaxID=455343 RepID=A0A4Y8ZJB5_9MICC|nr:DUF4259 domain-containing protein [Micrococcus endophyticus]MBB5849614.1 hypothetical protein [Micrococcus endophyticus]TFI49027.1 DUF4259 domain-containing protein [Micrococcus endophyticus]